MELCKVLSPYHLCEWVQVPGFNRTWGHYLNLVTHSPAKIPQPIDEYLSSLHKSLPYFLISIGQILPARSFGNPMLIYMLRLGTRVQKSL